MGFVLSIDMNSVDDYNTSRMIKQNKAKSCIKLITYLLYLSLTLCLLSVDTKLKCQQYLVIPSTHVK